MPDTDPRFLAAFDMLRRTGAQSVGVRYQDDDEPTIWMAVATYRVDDRGHPVPSGGKPTWEADAGHDPLQAVLRLCERVIDGGECAHCHRPSAFMADLAPTFLDAAICWTAWDPELSTFRRSCEGETERREK